MVGSFRRILLGLAWLPPATLVASRDGSSADPHPAVPAPGAAGRAGAEADARILFALPGEDPPQPFVPLHPQTVEDRQQIEARHATTAPPGPSKTENALDRRDRPAGEGAEARTRLGRDPPPPEPPLLRPGQDRAGHQVRQARPRGRPRRHRHDQPAGRTTTSEERPGGGRDAPEGRAGQPQARQELVRPPARRARARQALLRTSSSRSDKAADAFAKVVEALDEKAANRLSPADQKRILGGDETAAALTSSSAWSSSRPSGTTSPSRRSSAGSSTTRTTPSSRCSWRRPC